MDALRRFAAQIVASIYSPRFYDSMPALSGGGAIGYYLLLSLLLALVYGATALPPILAIHAEAPRWLDAAVGSYPPELQVRIANGQASTNVPEPYVVALPADIDPDEDTPRNLLVIDTKTPYSASQFDRYDTAAWLTRDTLFIRDDRQTRAIELTQIDDFTVDRGLIETIGDAIRPWLSLIAPVLLPIALGVVYTLYLARLLYLIVAALLIWLVARIFKLRGGYGLAYKTGLYAMTLPLIVDTLTGLTGVGGFPFMFTLILLAVVAANYAGVRALAAEATG